MWMPFSKWPLLNSNCAPMITKFWQVQIKENSFMNFRNWLYFIPWTKEIISVVLGFDTRVWKGNFMISWNNRLFNFIFNKHNVSIAIFIIEYIFSQSDIQFKQMKNESYLFTMSLWILSPRDKYPLSDNHTLCYCFLAESSLRNNF